MYRMTQRNWTQLNLILEVHFNATWTETLLSFILSLAFI